MDLIHFPDGRNFVGVEIKADVMNDNKENVKTLVLEVIKHQGDSSFPLIPQHILLEINLKY